MKTTTLPRGGGHLLARPGTAETAALQKALDAIARAFPVPKQHKKDLPMAVRDLSRILTEERGELHRPYWAAPRYLAAYLYFFLPWNLYRLNWLMPGLDIPLKAGARVLDLGSGPLTMPLALWCARPDLRNVPLDIVCSDVATQPMETGRAIFTLLAGEDSPWRFRLLRAPLEKALQSKETYDLILAGNVLNELGEERHSRRATSLRERLDGIMGSIRSRLADGGRCLLVEPGTRLGGKVIASSRQSALLQGMNPLAPCTHAANCPMLQESDSLPGAETERSAARFNSWCHFALPVWQAPQALSDISRQAKMEKAHLALSCLLLEKKPGQHGKPLTSNTGAADEMDELESLYLEMLEEDEAMGLSTGSKGFAGKDGPDPLKDRKNHIADTLDLRIISGPISLPGEEHAARYACCEAGLALLLDAEDLHSGSKATVPNPKSTRKDRKSGAIVLQRTKSGSSHRKPALRDTDARPHPLGKPRPAPCNRDGDLKRRAQAPGSARRSQNKGGK